MDSKISIKSDFRDWYDHVFYPKNNSDRQFFRMAHNPIFSLPKYNQFQIFLNAGMQPPLSGFPKDLTQCSKVVVYTDPLAHCGEGKILVNINEAIETYHDHFCSEWIQTHDDLSKAISYRHLQIGNRAWWLKYEGEGSWMSNHADKVEVTILEEIEPYEAFFTKHLPMYAIDYVRDKASYLYAIDLNTAPGTKYTGLDEVLSASDVYSLIENSGKLQSQ